RDAEQCSRDAAVSDLNRPCISAAVPCQDLVLKFDLMIAGRLADAFTQADVEVRPDAECWPTAEYETLITVHTGLFAKGDIQRNRNIRADFIGGGLRPAHTSLFLTRRGGIDIPAVL